MKTRIRDDANEVAAMKMESSPRVMLVAATLSLCCLLFGGGGHAGIPEPDHIIYGTAPDGAQAVWVMMEGVAHPLASFQIGGRAGLGGQYILRLPMDSVGVRAPGSVRSGDEVALYVDGEMATTAIVGSRGTAQFLDLSAALSGGGVSIADVTVVEGDTGTVDAVFRLTLTPASSETVTVSFEIDDETASYRLDFIGPGDDRPLRSRQSRASRRSAGTETVEGATSGRQGGTRTSTRTVEFPAGVTQESIVVRVLGDEVAEPDESFIVRLTEASGARIARGEALGIILNDDRSPVPAISIADARIGEGVTALDGMNGMEDGAGAPAAVNVNGGAGWAVADAGVMVTLSQAAEQEVTVRYATIEELATGGVDFLAQAGTVSFAPGETEKLIPITVLDDEAPEACERFLVRLDTAANARIADGEAVITILDDDGSAFEPEVGRVAVGSASRRVELERIFADPILILGPSTSRSSTPAVALAESITGTGFDLRIGNWNGGSTQMTEEELSYLVLERGRHFMPDGSIWEAGTFAAGESGEWTAMAFQEPFPGIPDVFFTVQVRESAVPADVHGGATSSPALVQSGATDSAALVKGETANPLAIVRGGGVDETGFVSALFTGGTNPGSSMNELSRAGYEDAEIGYLAVYSPDRSGIIVAGGMPVPYVLQETVGDESWQPVLSWSTSLQRLDAAALDAGDPVAGREFTPAVEDLSVLAVGRHLFAQDLSARTDGPVRISLQPPEREAALEWGTVTSVDEGWTIVPLARPYARPVVVAMPAADSGSEPVALRVRNVMEDSFEVSCAIWSGAGASCRGLAMTYLVAEEGEQALAGLTIRAGTEPVPLGAEGEWTDVVFDAPFDGAPVMFAGLQTDHAGQASLPRIHDRNADWFALSLHRSEVAAGTLATQSSGSGITGSGAPASARVGWIAIQIGEGVTPDGRRLNVFAGVVGRLSGFLDTPDFGASALGAQAEARQHDLGGVPARRPVILTGLGSAYAGQPGFLFLPQAGQAALDGSLQLRAGTGELLDVPEDICVFRAD